MMKKSEIVSQVMVRSSSDARRKYKVTRYKKGIWACSCMGWKMRHTDCKHIKMLKLTAKLSKAVA